MIAAMSRIHTVLLVLATCAAINADDASAQTTRKAGNRAEAKVERYDPSIPAPTLAGVRYGDHERHVLDFWKAESATPTPLVFVIHGGGWMGGSTRSGASLRRCRRHCSRRDLRRCDQLSADQSRKPRRGHRTRR